ncbi:MAG: hypothetical protein OEX81_00490 [Candidatus Pacebacteria bacterium]|nr:hypothetical protein [Candidatus Paceibacterota bacterium]
MADTTQAAPKKNPLDILEDILDNAEAQKEDNEAAAAEAKLLAEIKEKEEAARQADLAKLEEERAKMTAIESSPESQARLSQIKEKSEQKQEKEDNSKGFEIRQMGHTKI